MTSPRQLTEEHVGDLVITASAPVLHRRVLREGTATAVSRFGDPVWDLLPAVPDRHTANQAIHWDTYPEPFRHACKLYVFALLNVIEDAPRIAWSRSPVPSVKTIWADLGYLRLFLHWLDDRGIGTFAAVTETDLDHYYSHVMNQPSSPTWRRKALLAVQRLHLYRDLLPEFCRLPVRVLWGGATAAELAGAPDPRRIGNRTPRIHPDVMRPLLSAALLVTETIAADVLPVARQLVAMRSLAVQVAPPILLRRSGERSRWHAVKEHLDCVLPAFAEAGHALPGRREDRQIVVDIPGLSLAALLDRELLKRDFATDALHRSGLPVRADLLRVTRTKPISDRRWRDLPIETPELPALMRQISTACFIVIAYLSGLRIGEMLNLHRGCVTRDPKLDMIFLSGHQLKTTEDRANRSPATIPWVINEYGAHAIAVLEDLAPGQLLFPAGKFGSAEWLQSARSRTSGILNEDIDAFIHWFNTTIADNIGHPVIGTDLHGAITGMRFRRTLAWHIVRRPGGTIAGAQQYGHLFTRITHGYAGQADAGFLDEITFEKFLLRAEQLYDDHQRLADGEHVSGPAADLYRHRVDEAHQFNGLTVTTTAQANTALANPALQIHHGALLTCVWRSETAACQTPNSRTADGPSWPRCRPTCANIARTDRDIAAVRQHTALLRVDVDLPGLPQPLRQRLNERLTQHTTAITDHENGRA